MSRKPRLEPQQKEEPKPRSGGEKLSQVGKAKKTRSSGKDIKPTRIEKKGNAGAFSSHEESLIELDTLLHVYTTNDDAIFPTVLSACVSQRTPRMGPLIVFFNPSAHQTGLVLCWGGMQDYLALVLWLLPVYWSCLCCSQTRGIFQQDMSACPGNLGHRRDACWCTIDRVYDKYI